MHTTDDTTTRSVPPSRMALPPPRIDLLAGDAHVGWVDGRVIGFGGFGSATEAAHAATVAYQAMTRRFASGLGRQPPPVDTSRMSLQANGGVTHILAGDRPIATLVRPEIGSASGEEYWGFALQAPVPASELMMRAIAYRVYRALRRSGLPWTIWDLGRADTLANDS